MPAAFGAERFGVELSEPERSRTREPEGASSPPRPREAPPVSLWPYSTASAAIREANPNPNPSPTPGTGETPHPTPLAQGNGELPAPRHCEICGNELEPPSKAWHKTYPPRTCSGPCANRLRNAERSQNLASVHNPQVVAKVTMMWARGDKVMAIAAELRVTPNVICGLRARLNLPARANPIKRLPGGASQKRPYVSIAGPKRGAAGLAEAQAAVAPADPPPPKPRWRRSLFVKQKGRTLPQFAETSPEAAASGVDPLALERGHCHFPLTNGRPWRFCGEAAGPTSYCEAHRLRCFNFRTPL